MRYDRIAELNIFLNNIKLYPFMKEYSIKEIHSLFEKGELSSVDLVTQYIRRIEEKDKLTNAIIELNPDAIEIAKLRDEQREKGEILGPLHGIPVIIKDNIDTSDKMMTTAGSLALNGNFARKDAHIVSKMRDAGAIILAKANLSEWANFRGQRSSSGWSSRGGQTNNPYALDRNPCGSSSGSAVAVAANYCTVAIGTETDGSIICPSNVNGIVGIKPSIGLVSRSGIIPIAHSQDTAGPMARNVEDATILLGVITGKDDNDEQVNAESMDYTEFLDRDGLKGARLGYAKNINNAVPKISVQMKNVLNSLEKEGAELVEFDTFPQIEGMGAAEFEILLYEYKHGLNRYFANVEHINDIEDVIQFNKDNSDKVLQYFGQEYLISAAKKGELSSEQYIEALEKIEEARREITEFMDKNKLDALIAPSGGPAWKTDHINGDAHNGAMSTSAIAAATGFSNITVPAMYVSGLPVGLSFIGRAFAEGTIIKLAYAFEQATHAREVPEFIEYS